MLKMEQTELLHRLGREKIVIARIIRVEIEDIKAQFYYLIDFKQEYSSSKGFPRVLVFRQCS